MRLSFKLSLLVLVSLLSVGCATSRRLVTVQDLARPLTTVGQNKTPRVSVVAPPNTKVALELFRDTERVCTIVGQLVAYTHRMYYATKSNLLIADGVCYGSPIQASGLHRYVLRGYVISASGEKVKVGKEDCLTSPYCCLVEPVISTRGKKVVVRKKDCLTLPHHSVESKVWINEKNEVDLR